jgi:hypothetical protein
MTEGVGDNVMLLRLRATSPQGEFHRGRLEDGLAGAIASVVLSCSKSLNHRLNILIELRNLITPCFLSRSNIRIVELSGYLVCRAISSAAVRPGLYELYIFGVCLMCPGDRSEARYGSARLTVMELHTYVVPKSTPTTNRCWLEFGSVEATILLSS